MTVSTPSVHRALQGVPYSVKKLHIEKTTMKSTLNKTESKEFIDTLNAHIDTGNMFIFHGETNFNLYMARLEDKFCVSDRTTVDLPPTKAKTLHVQNGVSSGSGLLLLKRMGTKRMLFFADLFLVALRSEGYRAFDSATNVAIVMSNTLAHIGVEELTFKVLADDGIMNLDRLALLHLGPYGPILNHIGVYWKSINAKTNHYLTESNHEVRVRGDTSRIQCTDGYFDSEPGKHVITR
ncbi:Transposase [Phytophthora palmivora]|uniref:Transposase n=1 Tax=Phytophthora palmivora TaxID=4796 RepID=A0A2P4Y8J3_9STRA|nr:Transposase [Phytophthora palmivora]